MLALALAVAIGVGCWVWSARPHQLPPVGSAGSAGAPAVTGPPPTAKAGGSLMSPAANTSASAGTGLVIDVVGKVRHPGVYRMSSGARVDDAVRAAGGVLPGVDPVTVNLARRLADGEQLVIGLPAAGPGSAPAASPASGLAAPAAPGGPLDLNSATVAQLDALPGVGPVLAQRIIDWRTQHGRFDTVEQLQSVSGIGDAKYADLRPLVIVG